MIGYRLSVQIEFIWCLAPLCSKKACRTVNFYCSTCRRFYCDCLSRQYNLHRFKYTLYRISFWIWNCSDGFFAAKGGVSSMLGIVALFLLALGLGGLLQGSGALNTILDAFASRIKSVGGLIASTVVVSYITVGTSGVISFAAAITGTLMGPLYKNFGVRPENLSRTIEDTATQSAPLFPWSINSIFAAATLGVSPAAFIPFCFLAFLTPVFTLIYGFTGFTITKINPKEIDTD